MKPPIPTKSSMEKLCSALPWKPRDDKKKSENKENGEVLEISTKIRMIEYWGKIVAVPTFLEYRAPINTHGLEKAVFSFETIRPSTNPNLELRVYTYLSELRTAKAHYGKISSRRADITIKNVPVDVPPLCISRIVEDIIGPAGRLIAINFSDIDEYHYDIWLDKNTPVSAVVDQLANSLLAFPMSHGYAVYFKGEGERKFIADYLQNYYAQDLGHVEVFPTMLAKVQKN